MRLPNAIGMATPTMKRKKGKIQSVGSHLQAPPQSRIVDGKGHWVTPGLIDIHSHLGVYPSPGIDSLSDGNEATSPSTPSRSSIARYDGR